MKRYIKSTSFGYAYLAETCTDSNHLREFAEHPSAEIRFRVAINPFTPQDALITLLHDEDKDVRNGVALNESLPESVMYQIADLPSSSRTYKQKLNLINNIACPVDILEQLADDRNPDVAHFAQRRLSNTNAESEWRRDSDNVLRYGGRT